MVSIAPMLVAVNVKGPIQSIPDLIAAAKAKPNAIGNGDPGTASINHLAGEWPADAAGVKFPHALQRRCAGRRRGRRRRGADGHHGHLLGDGSDSGRLVKPLAVTTRQAQRAIQGLAHGEGGRRHQGRRRRDLDRPVRAEGTPKAIIDKLQKEMAAVLASPDVREKFAQGGAEPATSRRP